jgi:hypothetical protein
MSKETPRLCSLITLLKTGRLVGGKLCDRIHRGPVRLCCRRKAPLPCCSGCCLLLARSTSGRSIAGEPWRTLTATTIDQPSTRRLKRALQVAGDCATSNSNKECDDILFVCKPLQATSANMSRQAGSLFAPQSGLEPPQGEIRMECINLLKHAPRLGERENKDRRCSRIPHMTARWPSGSPAWQRPWRNSASSPTWPRLASRDGSNCGAIPDTLLVAAATPKNSIVFAAEGWPTVDYSAKFDAGTVALDVYLAIESGTYQGDVILRGTNRLLGQAGLAAATKDAVAIAGSGRKPVVVVLAERSDNCVSVVITVAEMELRTPA